MKVAINHLHAERKLEYLQESSHRISEYLFDIKEEIEELLYDNVLDTNPELIDLRLEEVEYTNKLTEITAHIKELL
tara:strand:+ start:1950 stop:2177 length:228 start_codon:yes stop_codon:yes gene_type:complete